MTIINTLVKEHEKNKKDIVGINSQLEDIPNQSYITEKATKSYVDTLTKSLASGSPKGTFATVSALQSDTNANTSEGKKSIYVVTADGGWYYWNGTTWTKGGAYQSTNIGEGTVGYKNITNPVQDTLFKNISGVITNPIIGTAQSSGRTRINKDSIPHDGILKSIKVHMMVGGNIKIMILSKNLDGTFNWIDEFNLTAVEGLNDFQAGIGNFKEIYVKKGWYIGYFGITDLVKISGLTGGIQSYYYEGYLKGNNIKVVESNTTLQIGYTVDIINTNETILENEINNIKDDVAIVKNKLETIEKKELPYYWVAPQQEEITTKIFWTYDNFINNTYEILRLKYPNYITRSEISKDTSNTFTIWEYVFAPKDYSRTVLLTSGIHGDEYEGYWSLYNFLKILSEDYLNNMQFRNMYHSTKFVVVPVLNPYGVENKTRFNVNGIECNKNFDVFWGIDGYEYEGTAPFSEKESLAVKTLCDKYGKFDLHVDVHTNPYEPELGNFLTITKLSRNYNLAEKLVIDEKKMWFDKYNKTISGLLNTNQRCSGFKYTSLKCGITSILTEFSPFHFSTQQGSSTEMTVATEWLSNIIIEHLKFNDTSLSSDYFNEFTEASLNGTKRANGFLEAYSKGFTTKNMKFWLDGNDFTNNPKTTSWLNKAGYANAEPNNFDYTSSSGSSGNGKVNLDGINDIIKLPMSIYKDYTLFFKIKIFDNGVSGARLISSDNENMILYVSKIDSTKFMIYQSSVGFVSGALTYNTELCLCVRWKDNEGNLFINGEPFGSVTEPHGTGTNLVIGNRTQLDRGLKCEISKFVAYDTALKDEDIYRNFIALNN